MHLLQEIHTLKKIPLHDRHVSLNAKMVSFGGWSMPVYYRGILEEHRWVRESCGIFDVSHLGEFHVHGRGAFAFLQARVTNDLRKLSNGKILYALLCDEKGFALDDLLIYQEALDDYYVIVNAANIERDFEAFLKYLPDSVKLENRSDVTACVAVQGPRSEEILKRVFGFDLNSLGYYCFKLEKTRWGPVWISRSGYTGEDGFEIFSSNDGILPVWDALVETGESGGLVPAGLGARNTLRLEAGNALYGNDLDETTTPLEAGLHWAVSFEKGGFVGRDGLMKQKRAGSRDASLVSKCSTNPSRANTTRFSGQAKKSARSRAVRWGPRWVSASDSGMSRRRTRIPARHLRLKCTAGKLLPKR